MKISYLLKVLILTFALSSGMAFAQTKDKDPTAFRKKISALNINSKNGLIRGATDQYEVFLQEQDLKEKPILNSRLSYNLLSINIKL
jgi:hypothetical protein